MIADAQVVAVVVEQFFEAGAGDVGELDFGLGGGERGFAGFEDVFLAGAGGLDHLVDGAVASAEVFVGEAEGDVVDDFGFLEGEERGVIAAWEEDLVAGGHGMGLIGPIGLMGPIIGGAVYARRGAR